MMATVQAAEAGCRKSRQQFMEGVAVEGTRTTVTIAAGQIGNELPINIVSERWFSPELKLLVMSRQSDPRFGETTYRLTNIARSEPSPRSVRGAGRLQGLRPGWQSRRDHRATDAQRCENSGPPARRTAPRADARAAAAVAAVAARRAGCPCRWSLRLAPARPGCRCRVPRAPLGIRFCALPLVGFARADLRDALRVRHLQPLLRARGVVEVGHRHPRQPLVDRALDVAELPSSSGATSVNADPVSSARAVRPTRWM